MKKIAVILLCSIIAISVSTAGVVFTPVANSTALAATANNNFETYLYFVDPNHRIASGATVNKQVGVFFTKYNTKTLIVAKNTQGPAINYSITNDRVEFPIINSATYTVVVASTDLFSTQQEIFEFTYDTENPSIFGYTSRTAIQSGEVIIGNVITVEAHDNLRGVQLFVAMGKGDPALCSGVTYKITTDGTYTFYAVDKAGNYSDDFTITYFSTAPSEPDIDPDEPDKPVEPVEPNMPSTQDEGQDGSEKSNGGIIAVAVIAALAVIVAITIIVIKKARENKIVAAD